MGYSEKNIIEEMTQVIDWYYDQSTVAPPDDLLDAEDRLSAFAYYLSDIIHNGRKEFETAEIVRKVAEARSEVSYLTANYSQKMAEKKAIIQSENLRRKERGLYADVHGLKAKLDQANRVLDSIRTRISWIKQEKQLTAQTQPSNEQH